MGLRIFLRDWIDFAAMTEFGIVLEKICGTEVGHRKFLSEEKRGEALDLENFCTRSKREKSIWT